MTSTIRSVASGTEPVVHVSDDVSRKSKRVDRPHSNSVSQTDKVLDERNREEQLLTAPSKRPLQASISELSMSKQNQEHTITSSVANKMPGLVCKGSNGVQMSSEGRSPVIREKVSEDGYHWRKYGQKFVRGNEFVRSYYRCTHPSCLVKKQLECSHGGKIADIVYFGQHDHPKPQHNAPVSVGLVVSAVEEKPEKAVSKSGEMKVFRAPSHVQSVNSSQVSTITSNDDRKCVPTVSIKTKDEPFVDDPISKRQKTSGETCVTHPIHEDKSTPETRVVVRTMSEVDIVNDGHRWRKYGQKMVKGNPNPRSYYRCSFPGCPVKKHVERASHDPKMVITSYEGNHEHDAPPSRTVTHNSGVRSPSQNGEYSKRKGDHPANKLGHNLSERNYAVAKPLLLTDKECEKAVVKETEGSDDRANEPKLLEWKECEGTTSEDNDKIEPSAKIV